MPSDANRTTTTQPPPILVNLTGRITARAGARAGLTISPAAQQKTPQAELERRADIITVLVADKRTGKSYSLRDGELTKKSVATAKGRATGVPILSAAALVDLLDEVTGDPSKVVIPGHFIGNDGDEPFDIIFEKELAPLLGKSVGDAALAGIHDIDGRRVAARLKRSIETCIWQLLDFDSPEGMPLEHAALDIAGRLALLEKVVPGISTCERIECRSSSARVVRPGGKPGRASHAWIQVSNPELVELLRVHIHVEAALHGLSFFSPHHSTKTNEIVGKSRLTLCDLSVLIPGRIVFCSAPHLADYMLRAGWSVVDAGVTIVNAGAGALDIAHLTRPTRERLVTYREKTGEDLKIGGVHGQSIAIISRGLLQLDTPINTDHARGVKTFGDALKWLQGQPKGHHLRCQTPFRESSSEAAFIALNKKGEPHLHDVGTATTYRLAERLDKPEPEKDDPPDEATISAEIERLAKLTVIGYQRERTKAAKFTRLSVGILDKLVNGKRDELAGGNDDLPEIVPWPNPVDGAALLDEMAAAIKRHAGVPTRAEHAISLLPRRVRELAAPRCHIAVERVRQDDRDARDRRNGAAPPACLEHHARRRLPRHREVAANLDARRGRHIPEGQRRTARHPEQRTLARRRLRRAHGRR
jgi:hypothetical protein